MGHKRLHRGLPCNYAATQVDSDSLNTAVLSPSAIGDVGIHFKETLMPRHLELPPCAPLIRRHTLGVVQATGHPLDILHDGGCDLN